MDRSELSELSKLMIFQDMTQGELEEACAALHPRTETCVRNQILLHTGDQVEDIYIVLEGTVRSESIDRWGNRSISAFYLPGQIFGVVSGTLGQPMLGSVVANEDCKVLMLERSALDLPRSLWRPWLFLLTRNLLNLTCRKNLILARRSVMLAPKRARDRVMAYLNQVYRDLGVLDFTIPFDQQQLADYLNLDRSVVSKELNKLKREGQLWFSRSHFILTPGSELLGERPEEEKN